MWSIAVQPGIVVVMLGRPRPNIQDQIRFLQEVRNWLYPLWWANIAQSEIRAAGTSVEAAGQTLGWRLQVNTKNPNHTGIRRWWNATHA